MRMSPRYIIDTFIVIFVTCFNERYSPPSVYPPTPHTHTHTHTQSGLYDYLLKSVDGFRLYIGGPDTERFNLVLFGGKPIPPSNP